MSSSFWDVIGRIRRGSGQTLVYIVLAKADILFMHTRGLKIGGIETFLSFT